MAQRRLIPIVILASAATLVATYLFVWFQVDRVHERSSDFSVQYVAGLMWREGMGAHLYDQSAENVQHALLAPENPTVLTYNSPPDMAVLSAPLSLLDVSTGYRLWGIVQLGLVVLSVALVARAAPWPPDIPQLTRWAVAGFAAAGVSTSLLLLFGQWDGFLALGLAYAYSSLRRERSFRGVFVLIATFVAIKLHLAIGLILYFVGRNQRRELLGVAGGLIAPTLLGLVVNGIQGYVAWWGALQAAKDVMGTAMLSIDGFATSWFGHSTATTAVVIAAEIAALIGCWVLGRKSRSLPTLFEATFAGAIVLSLIATPHMLWFDLVLLSPAVVWCITRANRSTVMVLTLGWLLLNALLPLDVAQFDGMHPGRITPIVLIVAGVAACWISLAQHHEKHLRALRSS